MNSLFSNKYNKIICLNFNLYLISMENQQPSIPLTFLVQNSVKNYEWGSTDPKCYVSELSKQAPSPTAAQLWMGTHPKGQSKTNTNIPLSQYITQKGLSKIQFLFKVLSIRKCLSLQVHPNKKQAVFLNQKYSSIYVDDNDKPEMFYTLTDFQCFLGFVNSQKLQQIIQIQPFNKWVSKEEFKTINVSSLVERILQTDQKDTPKIVKQAAQNIPKLYPNRIDLYNRLAQQFPNDIGLVVSFLLNYYQIQSNKCFYIPCKTPHAYIKGECLQIMKNSDNVIRMGLTPKLKDLNVLPYILTNTLQPLNEIIPSNGVYSSENLHFRVIHEEASFEAKVLSIGIVVEGSFQAYWFKDKIERKVDIEKGNIFILQVGLTYNIKGKGLLCFGWSTFEKGS